MPTVTRGTVGRCFLCAVKRETWMTLCASTQGPTASDIDMIPSPVLDSRTCPWTTASRTSRPQGCVDAAPELSPDSWMRTTLPVCGNEGYGPRKDCCALKPH